MKRTVAVPARIAKLLVATALCLAALTAAGLLTIWLIAAVIPGCRYALDEWTWQGRPVPKRELCPGEFAVRPLRRQGRDCLQLFALKDGLPVGERCREPGAR